MATGGRLRWSTVGFVATLAASLTGCGGSNPGMAGEDPRIIIHDFEGGMDASITGTLEYDADSKCLFIRHDNGSLSAPLWPDGTRPILEDGKRGVDVRGYGRILEGETIAAGGGGTTRSEVDHLDIAEACIPDVEFGTSGLLVITELDQT